MAKGYCRLTEDQIAELISQRCSCADWSKVEAAENFCTSRVRNSHFSGEIKLGALNGEICTVGGVTRKCGIYDATLHNCTVGNDVLISGVGNIISNYIIGDKAVIIDVGTVAVEGESCFGNGVKVAAVNEAGGREIPIYDELSAQIAYLIAFYRHRGKTVDKIGKMIEAYADSVRSSTGQIGPESKLIGCSCVKNVKIGPGCVIDGALRVENGSLNGTLEAPAYIGQGVIAEDFICSNGSKVSDSTIISKCFVGQAVSLGRQFTAENSVFFANCEGFAGEACSVFAGPYSVTHHKSTLLIGGYFSFFNAGSGTNQSNHMYKLGPVHQGVLERGCKTGSDSYMLWPARLGAFSVVVGRHYERPDSGDFPFSYLTESHGRSWIAPGTNLRKCGLIRDAKKWPNRDKRIGNKADLINFGVLSPYTMEKILRGMSLLEKHRDSGKGDLYIRGATIPAEAIKSGIRLYRMAVDIFVGERIINRLTNRKIESAKQLADALSFETEIGANKWVDIAGLLAPTEAVEDVLANIEEGKINSTAELANAFASIFNNYEKYDWKWTASVIDKRIGNAGAGEMIKLLESFKMAVNKMAKLNLADAQKEFCEASRTGYGIDGDKQEIDADFEAVRGTFEQNSFVGSITKSAKAQICKAEEVITLLSKLNH